MSDNLTRIPYGEETHHETPDGRVAYLPRDAKRCHDCGVERGEVHCANCDVEQCPICRTQLISCEHWAQVMANE